MSANTDLSPRQKMINLMYIVLTAMLALNVSSDVLIGFEMVGEEMNRSVKTYLVRNRDLMNELSFYYQVNPGRMKSWYQKALTIHHESDSLYAFIQDLKMQIVRQADGEHFDVEHIVRQDNLDASSQIMLSNSEAKGIELKQRIIRFRELAGEVVASDEYSQKIAENLNTDLPEKFKGSNLNWQEALFENMPVVAAVTILSELQSNVLYTESEVLHHLSTGINDGVVGVNLFKPYVIPTTKNVISGGTYSARVVLAAIDSTQRPDIYVDGKLLDKNKNGWYEKVVSQTGEYKLKGKVVLRDGMGGELVYPFEEPYTVVTPTATVSATMMNLLYLGIDNPLSISVPGVPNEKISATMTNGTLKRNGNNWIAKPAKANVPAEIVVTALQGGRSQVVNRTSFRVRPLPSPSPLIEYIDANGNKQKYKGGRLFPKATLLSCEGITAAIDDGILDIQFRVLSFETVFFDSMGNALLEISNGASFSQRQKDSFKRLSHGKRFYISRVKAVGPDGIEKTLNTSMEVIVQ